MKHWTYPHEIPTKFNQIYSACGRYVNMRETVLQIDEVTCPKCKQLASEYESSGNEIEL